MKKRRIRLKARFWVILAIFIFAYISLSSCGGNDVRTEKMVYVVQSGDTLWDIAEEYAPDSMDIREYIRRINEHNNLDTLDIYPEMVLLLETEVTE